MTHVLLSIDPGDHAAGLALFVDDDGRGLYGGHRFLGVMTAHAKTAREARDEIRVLVSALEVPLPGPFATWTALIERDTNPNNRAAIESLAASRRIWLNAVADFDSMPDVHEVAPQSWQGPMGLLGKLGKSLGGTKEASLAVARVEFHIDPTSSEESDAALMGAWWLQEGGVEGERRRTAGRETRDGKARRGGWTEEEVLKAAVRGMGR